MYSLHTTHRWKTVTWWVLAKEQWSWWKNMTVCHMPWIVFLSHPRSARPCLMIKTDTTLDLDWGTAGNCMHARLALSCHCRQQMWIWTLLLSRGLQNAEVPFNKETKEARLPTDSRLNQFKTSKLGQPHRDQSRVSKRSPMARAQSQPGPEKASALSAIARSWTPSQVLAKFGVSLCSQNFALHVAIALHLALALSWSVHREKCSHSSTAHQCTRSTLSTVCFCSRASHRVSVFTSGLQPRREIHHKLVTFILLWSEGSMVSRIPFLQTCNVVVVLKTETGFVPTSAQFFAVSTFLILRSPSWTRSCIQKYRVSMCFVRCPSSNRSVKDFAVENCTA